jgi:hypothetical protein
LVSKNQIILKIKYPTVSKTYPYSSKDWKQLISLVDSKAFQAINDVIGCPDCADGDA